LASKLHIKEQMMNREDAFAIVNKYVKNPNLESQGIGIDFSIRLSMP